MAASADSPAATAPTEASLIKLVRTLDQGGADRIPQRLTQLWAALSSSAAGRFHASEEMILRWLLRHMNGSTPAAERMRRYPLAWNIMGCVFGRIPLFSLAKSLADRRFIAVLQQTLKDISRPRGRPSGSKEASPDVEMADAPAEGKAAGQRKRKRAGTEEEGADMLHSTRGCLTSAESLLGALRTLLARAEHLSLGQSPNDRMGAEHVKSLFSMPAAEILEILRPVLAICNLALDEQAPEPFEEQASWVATFVAIWNLHLQGHDDASEVATNLSLTGCVVLGKLLDLPRPQGLAIDRQVRDTWARHLRRFFVTHLVLPARAAFLNRRDNQILATAVDVTDAVPTISCPVLFSLVLKAPAVRGEASAKKDNEAWIQTAFQTLEAPLRRAKPDARNDVVRGMLDMAAEAGVAVPLSNLRAVCKEYALADAEIDWALVARVAECDSDVFLLSQDGQDLLGSVCQGILDSAGGQDDDKTKLATDFVVSLARGSAKGRELPGFFKRWFENLSACFSRESAPLFATSVWTSPEVGRTAAGLLQPSLSPKQLQSLLDWLVPHAGPVEDPAVLVVLDAIADGLSEEDFVDSVDLRLFEEAYRRDASGLKGTAKASARWNVAGKTLSWATLEQANDVWARIQDELRQLLLKGPVVPDPTAFAVCYQAWLANYPGGQDESAAADLALSALERLTGKVKGVDSSVRYDLLQRILAECPRLLDLSAKRKGGLEPIASFLKKDPESTLGLLASNEANMENRVFLSNFVAFLIERLSKSPRKGEGWLSPSRKAVVESLLKIPQEAFSREQREEIMQVLLESAWSTKSHPDYEELVTCHKLVLSLMARLMRRPTYYKDMAFADLVTVGQALADGILKQSYHSEVLLLFEDFALETLRQMTTIMEAREKSYLSQAAQLVSVWKGDRTRSGIIKIVLLRALALCLEQSSPFKALVDTPINLATVKETLSSMLADGLLQVCQDLHGGKTSYRPGDLVLVLPDRLDAYNSEALRESLSPSLVDIRAISDELAAKGFRAGWKLKSLLVSCLGDESEQLLYLKNRRAASPGRSVALDGSPASGLDVLASRSDISQYVDVLTASMDDSTRKLYLKVLIDDLDGEAMPVERFYAVYRLIQQYPESSSGSPAGEKFDMATAHNLLARHLAKVKNPLHFALIAQNIYMLLETKSAAMTQWNVEVTLSTVSQICIDDRIPMAVKTPKTYYWLCRLVEIILKRHRLRLEGHFHLLVTTLQSLLRQLAVGFYEDVTHQEKNAKQFARLVTLVCEPAVASVTRSQAGNLDSATDAAKRSAGQHMYLVLMLYIKLQLEHSIDHGVREALEPGVYSILDITTPELRRVMGEAMDASGRAIFKELHRQYIKFGKWSGI